MQSGAKIDILAIQKVKSYFQSKTDRINNADKYKLKERPRKAYLENGAKLSKVKPLTNDTE